MKYLLNITRLTCIAALMTVANGFTKQASAAVATIIQYDIFAADISGSGGWSHAYSGLITPTGGSLANYTGGVGTLNDGIIINPSINNQLFLTPTAPVEISFFFDQSYTFSQIEIFGADGDSGNNIPGNISGFDIAIGAATQSLLTTGFGGVSSDGQLVNDRVDLVAAGLSAITANFIVLSNFTVFDLSNANRRFNISEIVFSTSSPVSVVPIPAALPLFGTGIGLLGFFSWRKKRRSAIA